MKRKENMEKPIENLFSNLTFFVSLADQADNADFFKLSRLKPASFDSCVAKKDLLNLRNLREIKMKRKENMEKPIENLFSNLTFFVSLADQADSADFFKVQTVSYHIKKIRFQIET